MSHSSKSLDSLVSSLVPQARRNENLKRELTRHCEEILNSHIGQSRETDIGHLSDLIKRQLLQTHPDGVSSLQFTNLLSRLLEQPVLSRKHASILFLQTLASSSRASSFTSTFLPALAPPPPPSTRTTPIPSPADPIQSTRLPRGKSKAEILKDYRAKTGRPHLSEDLLLRDTLYLLQGISGKYVHFAPIDNDENKMNLVFVDDPRYTIPPATRALIHRLSEVGHLYTLVDTFVRDRESQPGVGMIEQSLCHHLQSQLTEYYRLIAILESQMTLSSRRPGWDDKSSRTTSADIDIRAEESGLTLRRLDVWVNEWRLRMRMMSVCVESARDTKGGALVNLIHSYTENGDPFVRHFTDQLLEEVSKPFFSTLHRWLFSGELYDPYSEFFVSVDPELAHLQYLHPSVQAGGPTGLSGDGGFGGLGGDNEDLLGEERSGRTLWETKHQFRKEMLPTFVDEEFGKMIFSTGKSLNFIRYSCHDSDWVATREKLSNTGGTLQYSDISGLERSIHAAYRIASHRLFDIFFEKFKLMDHFKALKNYLLLGHGDFVDQLMEALGPNLSRPANALHRHSLTATLETAIRSSNAQDDPPDVLRRLDCRMLEYTHGEIGWDVFTLEYKVDAPIDTVLDGQAMVDYTKLFKFLWQTKRVGLSLTKGWMRVASGTKVFIHVPELEQEWHRIRLTVAEMVHFIRSLEAQCQLEVIERSWKELIDFINRKEKSDLDGLITAHRKHLDRMVKKILMLDARSRKEEVLLNAVHEVFQTILQFREATDNFYNHCLTESARRDTELDAQRGVFTGHARQSSTQVPTSLQQVKEYSAAFTEKVQMIVHQLGSHSDLDVRFLGVRLSFSDYYRSRREKEQRS